MTTRILTTVFISSLLFSCSIDNNRLDKKKLISLYNAPKDSLKQKAAEFLLDNMSDQTSDIPDDYSFSIVPDSEVIRNRYLAKDINLAFRLWNKYPWAENVPEDVFMNYLLPYKVYGEEPTEWRNFFEKKYSDTIQLMLKELESNTLMKSANEVYYRLLLQDVGYWCIYDNKPDFKALHPGFNELMELKSADCLGWSYLNVMLLRAFGIPSSIDIIPLWGRKNGSHSTEVFWDSDLQKFRTASGRELYYPAKVFRYTYKIRNIWKDSIEPYINNEYFILDLLKNNHLIDVTHEHTKTANIEYQYNTDKSFAYICVYNYGMWVPVYYGRNESGKFAFKNMGTELCYRIALPGKTRYEIISPVFKVDSAGEKIFYKPDHNKLIAMKLSKLNTGKSAWVDSGKVYNLYFHDEKGGWMLHSRQKCGENPLLIFHNVPSGTLYLLQENENGRHLERPFTYTNKNQIFY